MTPAVAPLPCSAVLTHHWLVRRRGGERVLEALRHLLPEAPLYTLVHDPAGYRLPDLNPPGGCEEPTAIVAERAAHAESPAARRGPAIHTSRLQRIPGATRYYPRLLPLMHWAARGVRLPPARLVVCSDAALAKAMRPHPESRVVCYCHSPMRYVWDLADVYRETLPRVLRPLWNPLAARIRAHDRAAARTVDRFVANSRNVAERIRRSYGRDSVVVHPPVDVPDAPHDSAPQPQRNPGRPDDGRASFFLCVGHHVRYKRLDLAVDACRELGQPLVVIGEGPETKRLAGAAHVRFLGWQPDDIVRDHYRRARGLLFPGEEDFGIVPVEAMAHGCPVIALGTGGACETVVDGRTGVLFREQTAASLASAMRRAGTIAFDPRDMYAHARTFRLERFLEQMRSVLEQVLGSDHERGV